MAKKISKVLVIIASPFYHQDKRSNTVNYLCKEFIDTLQGNRVNVDLIDLYHLPNYSPVYHPEQKPDKTTIVAQKKVEEADLIAFFHPVWMGGLPAILKGFLEQVFAKGFAYHYEKKFLIPHFKNKKAIICIASTKPKWHFRFLYRDIIKNFWQRVFTELTGIKVIKYYHFGEYRNVNDKQIIGWRKKIRRFARQFKPEEEV